MFHEHHSARKCHFRTAQLQWIRCAISPLVLPRPLKCAIATDVWIARRFTLVHSSSPTAHLIKRNISACKRLYSNQEAFTFLVNPDHIKNDGLLTGSHRARRSLAVITLAEDLWNDETVIIVTYLFWKWWGLMSKTFLRVRQERNRHIALNRNSRYWEADFQD